MKKLVTAIMVLATGAAFAATSVDLKENKLAWKATKKAGAFHEGVISLKLQKQKLKVIKLFLESSWLI